MDSATRERIETEKFNCLCAEHLHVRALQALDRKITLVDAAALIVPVLYFPARYLGKGTLYSPKVELGWELTAAFLIGLTIWKFVDRWQERFNNHGKLLGENITLKRQAVDLLNDGDATPESAQAFLALAARTERDDRGLLRIISPRERQDAYREALKESGGTHVSCPICHSSPWNFKRGSCQLCGNIPASQKVN
jgi:mobilome CxxCx(11)CxxC protein